MARQEKHQDHSYCNLSPKVHVDYCNPQQGFDGGSVYGMYMVTDFGDSATIGLSENGRLNFHADQTIEIIGGAKSQTKSPTVIIATPNGNINITAMENGEVLIEASNIVVNAIQDLRLEAGRNMYINAKNKIELDALIFNKNALCGNGAPELETFDALCFDDPDVYAPTKDEWQIGPSADILARF